MRASLLHGHQRGLTSVAFANLIYPFINSNTQDLLIYITPTKYNRAEVYVTRVIGETKCSPRVIAATSANYFKV